MGNPRSSWRCTVSLPIAMIGSELVSRPLRGSSKRSWAFTRTATCQNYSPGSTEYVSERLDVCSPQGPGNGDPSVVDLGRPRKDRLAQVRPSTHLSPDPTVRQGGRGSGQPPGWPNVPEGFPTASFAGSSMPRFSTWTEHC